MTRLVVYGVGSPIVTDVEESAHRAGLAIVLGIRNVAAPSLLSREIEHCTPETIPEALRGLPILVPLFTPGHRQRAQREAEALGLAHRATLVDPTAIRPRDLVIGEGSYINAACIFGSGGVLGAFALVNRGANIGHHARFGRFVSVGPGAVIAGGVTLGDGAVVGTGAVLLPGITVEANAVVAAGAVVTKDVEPECLVGGNPARTVRRGIGGYKGVSVR